MHNLQPKHSKLKPDEVHTLLTKFNISISQLPRIKLTDAGVPEGSQPGDILKIERKEEGETVIYYRIVA